MYLIPSKFKGLFNVFASTFLSTKDVMGDKFIMAKLEEFCEHLTREETKISTLDSYSSSSKTLIASKGKGKPKPKPNTTTPQPPPKALNSKSTPEKEKPIYSYCGKLGSIIEKCYKKMKDDKKK